MADTPKLNLTDAEIENLIRRIHEGSIDELNLPEEYYQHVGSLLEQGLMKGLNIKDATEISAHNPALVEKLTTNVYQFSAAKTFSQTQEMMDALTTEDGTILSFSKFKQAAADIYAKYNGGDYMQDQENMGWLQTEYNSCVSGGQHCVNWDNIEKGKKLFPYVKRNEVEDANECEICEPFNNMLVPVDDPIVDSVGGEIHFNCRGFWEQVSEDDGDEQYDKEKSDKVFEDNIEKVPEMFRNNPAKTGEIFTRHTPAFDVPEKYREFAKSNFGLPLPNEDE